MTTLPARNSTNKSLRLLLVFVCTVTAAVAADAQTNYEPYAFTTLAGDISAGSIDGPLNAARFRGPRGQAVDSSGNVYVADTNNNTIRKITPEGVVSTLAGMAGNSGNANGTGSAARFSYPHGVTVDKAGNVYVADWGNRVVRKITAGGVVSTFAGSGIVGNADGLGTAAYFSDALGGVAADEAGNIYIADTNNNTIRKITPAGSVSTLAGKAGYRGSTNGTGSAARFNTPYGVAVDSTGNVYVADTFNNTIRKIDPTGAVTTLAGLAGSGGTSDGMGSAARFRRPQGVAVDGAGYVYVADTNNYTVRQITPAGFVTTLAGSGGIKGYASGTGSSARFSLPVGVAVSSSGSIYVGDADNNTIREITAAAGVTVLAGCDPPSPGANDGPGSAARFYAPTGLAADSTGTIYVADMYNNRIRKITQAGVVSTLAYPTGAQIKNFRNPYCVTVDSAGNVYVADTGNQVIRKITPAGAFSTLAGVLRTPGSTDAVGNAALFNSPQSVTVDNAGNVYVADSNNHTIRKITPGRDVSTLAGWAGNGGYADGTGSAARFNYPTGVAVDVGGNVYVADIGNRVIRKVTPAGVVTTLAGLAGYIGSSDGSGSAARFRSPAGVAVDNAGNVYVAENGGNNIIRKITPAGVVTTLAGLANSSGSADGVGSAVRFNGPFGVAVDGEGRLYVADTANNEIRAGREATQRLEMEDLGRRAKSAAGDEGVISDVNMSGGAGRFFNALANGDFVTYTVPIAQAGSYNVKVAVKTRNQKGIFQLSVDGVNQGMPQDCYSPVIGYSVRDLGTVTFSSAGDKAFTFLVTGRNPSSIGYTLTFDYIELLH